jgi:hypothetical protein
MGWAGVGTDDTQDPACKRQLVRGGAGEVKLKVGGNRTSQFANSQGRGIQAHASWGTAPASTHQGTAAGWAGAAGWAAVAGWGAEAAAGAGWEAAARAPALGRRCPLRRPRVCRMGGGWDAAISRLARTGSARTQTAARLDCRPGFVAKIMQSRLVESHGCQQCKKSAGCGWAARGGRHVKEGWKASVS